MLNGPRKPYKTTLACSTAKNKWSSRIGLVGPCDWASNWALTALRIGPSLFETFLGPNYTKRLKKLTQKYIKNYAKLPKLGLQPNFTSLASIQPPKFRKKWRKSKRVQESKNLVKTSNPILINFY